MLREGYERNLQLNYANAKVHLHKSELALYRRGPVTLGGGRLGPFHFLRCVSSFASPITLRLLDIRFQADHSPRDPAASFLLWKWNRYRTEPMISRGLLKWVPANELFTENG